MSPFMLDALIAGIVGGLFWGMLVNLFLAGVVRIFIRRRTFEELVFFTSIPTVALIFGVTFFGSATGRQMGSQEHIESWVFLLPGYIIAAVVLITSTFVGRNSGRARLAAKTEKEFE